MDRPGQHVKRLLGRNGKGHLSRRSLKDARCVQRWQNTQHKQSLCVNQKGLKPTGLEIQDRDHQTCNHQTPANDLLLAHSGLAGTFGAGGLCPTTVLETAPGTCLHSRRLRNSPQSVAGTVGAGSLCPTTVLETAQGTCLHSRRLRNSPQSIAGTAGAGSTCLAHGQTPQARLLQHSGRHSGRRSAAKKEVLCVDKRHMFKSDHGERWVWARQSKKQRWLLGWSADAGSVLHANKQPPEDWSANAGSVLHANKQPPEDCTLYIALGVLMQGTFSLPTHSLPVSLCRLVKHQHAPLRCLMDDLLLGVLCSPDQLNLGFATPSHRSGRSFCAFAKNTPPHCRAASKQRGAQEAHAWAIRHMFAWVGRLSWVQVIGVWSLPKVVNQRAGNQKVGNEDATRECQRNVHEPLKRASTSHRCSAFKVA
eukprot:1160937-Pelagomonas_calceolata.AAC.8